MLSKTLYRIILFDKSLVIDDVNYCLEWFGLNTFVMSPKRLQRGSSVRGSDLLVNNVFKVTRPSFLEGYHPTLKLSGIPTFTFIVSLTHRMDNI